MIDLTLVDKIKWKEFLATPAGMRGVIGLKTVALTLPVSMSSDPHKTALEAGAIDGYRRAVLDIESLCVLDNPKDDRID